jgi:hypothetical protein
MNKQYQIQVVRIDNGFIIVASSDTGKRAKLQADTEEKVKKHVQELVEHMFDPAEKKA